VRDPLARELFEIAERAGPYAERLAPALLEVHSIFGALGADPRMRIAVTGALSKLYALGARQTVQTFQPA
jgi:fructuronate reductase